MKHTAQYINLETVILDYISEANLTEAAYLRLWHLAVRGMEWMGLTVGGEPVTRKIGVNPNKTVDLPNDYLQWVKVGILNNNGEVATLRRNPGLSKYAVIDGDRISLNSASGGSDDSLFRNYWHESSCYNLFGANSGTETLGQFDVDDVNGVILLDSDYEYDYVILEYLSSPTHNSDFRVKVQLREPLIAWLAWKDIINMASSRRVNLGEKQLRRSEFFRTWTANKKYINPMRLEEANDVIRLGQKLAVKS